MTAEATANIRSTLNLFSFDGALIEVRAMDCGDRNRDFRSTRTGLFEPAKLEDAARHAVGAEKIHQAGGVYVTLNPVKRDLLARAANRMVKADRGGTTKDDEIISRRWMLIDLDPKRPSGVSSTDEELATAEEQAKECRVWLCDNGWPHPVIAMSGNGWHLLYRVDLPAADKRVEACLKALAMRFTLVDSVNHNPARITKLYGTLARKGDSTPDRPHRRSRLVEVPETINVVHPDCLDWLAGQAQKKPVASPKSSSGSESFDLDLYLRNRRVTILKEDTWDGSRRLFITCPGIASHTTQNAETDCSIWQDSSGQISAKCFHNSCGIRTWADVRDALGRVTNSDFPKPPDDVHLSGIVNKFTEGSFVKCGDRGNIGTVVSDDGGPTVTVHFVSPEGVEATVEIPRAEVSDPVAKSPAMEIRSAATLIKTFPNLRPPVIDGLLRRGECMNVIAPPKFGKSWFTTGLGLAVSRGDRWLGRFCTTRGRVLLIDNELHAETSAHRLPWIARAMQIPAADYEDQFFVANLRGQLVDINKLAQQLMEVETDRFSLIILDAMYRFQPAGTDENSNADVTAIYNTLDSVANKIGSAFVTVHHSSKGNQAAKGITDVGSGAGAQARAPDCHLIMRAHEEENCVTVDAAIRSFAPLPSFCMRWEFPIWSVVDDLDPKALKQERPKTKKVAPGPTKDEIAQDRYSARREKLSKALALFPDGETESQLATKAGLSNKDAGPIFMDLLEAKIIEQCSITKNKVKYPAVRLIMTRSDRSDEVGQTGVIGPIRPHRGGVGRTAALPMGSSVQSDPATHTGLIEESEGQELSDRPTEFGHPATDMPPLWLPPDRTNGGQPA